MKLQQALAAAKTEEEVKAAYVKAIGLKLPGRGKVDIQMAQNSCPDKMKHLVFVRTRFNQAAAHTRERAISRNTSASNSQELIRPATRSPIETSPTMSPAEFTTMRCRARC